MDFRDLAGMSGAMYLRKSRKDSESETIQEVLTKHKRELMEFVTRWKLNLVDIFEEVVSGDKIEDRPEIQKVLNNVEELEYDFVLAMDLDRLGRGDMEDQGKILSAFKETDTLIVTTRKVYDLNDELDEEVSEMETFFARRELKTIKRRLLRGRKRSARDGKFIGSIPPFGYDRNEECVLIPNKDSELIKTIFNWFVNGDELGKPMGAYKIAKRLTLMNIPTPTGKKTWQPNTILTFLINQVYVGRIVWEPKTKRKNQSNNQKNRDSEKIDVLGKHEPIIEQEVFDKAQIMLKEKANPKLGSNKNSRNPLLGIGMCGVCGRHMQVKKPGVNRQLRYRCMSVECENISSVFDLVEERVLLKLELYLKELIVEEQKIKDNLETQTQIDNPYPKMIEQIKKELSQIEEQEDNLDTLLEQGVYDIAKYTKRSKKLKEEIELKQNSLKSLIRENELVLQKENSLPKQIEIITNVIQAYKQTKDILLKNKLLKTVISKVIYTRQNSDDFEIDLVVKQL